LLLRHLPEKAWTLVAAVLWLCECLTYSYTWLGADHAAPVVWISQRMPIVFDAAFRALPLMLLGSRLARNKPQQNKKRLGMLLVCGILYAAEVYALRSVTERLSYVIFTPILTVCLFALLLTSKQCSLSPSCGSMLRFSSTVIYCVHPMILELLPLQGVPGFFRWVTASALCLLLSLALTLGRKIYRKEGTS
jgi:branched-subunit amino acid transport protein AzlD